MFYYVYWVEEDRASYLDQLHVINMIAQAIVLSKKAKVVNASAKDFFRTRNRKQSSKIICIQTPPPFTIQLLLYAFFFFSKTKIENTRLRLKILALTLSWLVT